MRAVVTVLGKDKTGIIYNVSKVLAERNANIDDLSQTVLQDIFSMVMIVDLDKINCDFTVLKEELEQCGQRIDLDVRIQREDIFNSMHSI